MVVRFIVKTGCLLVTLLLLPVSGLTSQEGEPLTPVSGTTGINIATEQITPGTPTPITVPITLVPTLTGTVTLTPTVEPQSVIDQREREAALSTLEEIGLRTLTQSAADTSDSLSPIIIDPSPTPSATPTASSTPSPVSASTEIVPSLTPLLELTNVGISEEVFTMRRSPDAAGRDAIILLIISAGVLLVWYLWMSHNLKNRDFSKYK
jgi:hypothetical protein